MTDPLPVLPVPAPVVSPGCEWCGERPAERYEVAPQVKGIAKQMGQDGRMHSTKVVRKHAIFAYACRRHRDIFDVQKDALARAREEARQQR